MIKIVEDILMSHERQTLCYSCGTKLTGFLSFPVFCKGCMSQLPDYMELLENQDERIQYFILGEHWEKG